MKFKAVGSKFNEGLSRIKSVIRSSDALNPFANVRVDTMGDSGVRLTATDGDIQIETTVFCDVFEQGACIVNGERIVSFSSSMMIGPTEFAADDKNFSMGNGGTQFRIRVGDVADFPEMHRPGVDACCVTIPSITLGEMLRKSVYAASTDKTRALLRGVNVCVKDGLVTMTATDGRRLATVEHEVESDHDGDIIISSGTAKIVRGLCGTDGDVTIETDGKTVYIRGEQWCVTSKLIEDSYPNWRQVIPAASAVPNMVHVCRADFIRAIEQCALADKDGNGVKLNVESGCIKFSAKSSVSSATSFTTVKYDGPVIEKKVNAQLMVEALSCVDEDFVDLHLGADSPSCLVRCSVPYQAVVMFIRKDS